MTTPTPVPKHPPSPHPGLFLGRSAELWIEALGSSRSAPVPGTTVFSGRTAWAVPVLDEQERSGLFWHQFQHSSP